MFELSLVSYLQILTVALANYPKNLQNLAPLYCH
jgi:hypothetical protein